MQLRKVRNSDKTIWAACCLCLIIFGPPSAFASESERDESLLKAAFVYNFAKFTRWPSGTWSGPRAAFNLCTAGNDQLEESLGRLSGETVRGHPVAIMPFESDRADQVCHVLYIAGSEHHHFAGLLDQTRNRPVLTISQIRGFADAGGIIQLFRAGDRVRFRINHRVARDRGLELSARLLDLAEIVDDGVAP